MVEITDGLTRVPNSVDNFVGFDEPNSYDTAIAADCLIEGNNVPSPSALTDVKQNDRGIKVTVDRGRDARLTDFGKATLLDRYLMPGEHFQDLFARVAMHFADDTNHAQRLYDYISNLWFMPSTPVLSASMASLACGTRMSGWRLAVAASAATGAIFDRSARRSASTAKLPA